jgi:3-phosphoshikimate 1-carboxyvinyltransferase
MKNPTVKITPAGKFKGSPVIPGDKSISHRGLIFGALAEGRTEVIDILESGDVQSTARCLQQLGVKITKSGNRTFVDGVGLKGFTAPREILDCGNSGTTIRLLMGVLAGQSFEARMTGDSSLVRRPMKRVAEPLRQMGAKFELTNEDYAPLTVKGSSLKGVTYSLKVASAQIKTAITLAGLLAEGTTTITGEIHSRDHTERLLKYFGVDMNVTADAVSISGGQKLKACTVQVPGDPSTAAFWMGAACLIPGSQLELVNIALNPTRIGFLRALERMGAKIDTQITSENPEPIGRIRMTSGPLKGIKISADEVPTLIDELPLFAVLATQAQGVTEVEGAEELRVKESDRIEATATALRAMKAEIEVRKDGYKIQGVQKLHGAVIDSFHDHRIAMAFSIAGLVAQGETEILHPECVSISYPAFFETLKELTKG